MKTQIWFFSWGTVVGLLASALFLGISPVSYATAEKPAQLHVVADPIIVAPKSEVTVHTPYNETVETSDNGRITVTLQALDEDQMLAKFRQQMQQVIDANEAHRPLPKFGVQ